MKFRIGERVRLKPLGEITKKYLNYGLFFDEEPYRKVVTIKSGREYRYEYIYNIKEFNNIDLCYYEWMFEKIKEVRQLEFKFEKKE